MINKNIKALKYVLFIHIYIYTDLNFLILVTVSVEIIVQLILNLRSNESAFNPLKTVAKA